MEPRRWRIQHRHHGRLGGNHPGCRLRHRQPRDSHDVGDRRACGRGRDVRRGADDVRRLGRLCDPGHGRPHVQVLRQRRRRPGRRASDRRPDRHRDRRAGQLHPFHRTGGRLRGKRASRRPGGRDDAGRAQRLAGGQWGGRNLLGGRAALQPARRSLRRCLGRHRLRRWRASPSQHLRSQQQTRPEGDGGERRRSGDEPNVLRSTTTPSTAPALAMAPRRELSRSTRTRFFPAFGTTPSSVSRATTVPKTPRWWAPDGTRPGSLE